MMKPSSLVLCGIALALWLPAGANAGPRVDLSSYLGGGHRGEDIGPALQKCVNDAGARGAAGTCEIGAGDWTFNSDMSRPIAVPNNVTIQGQGRDATTIRVTGSKPVNGLFVFAAPNDDWIRDLTLAGNAVLSCANCAGIVSFYADQSTANGPMANFGLVNVGLTNVSADYWVYVRNASGQPMRNILFDGIYVKSTPHACRDLTAIGAPCDVIALRGQTRDNGGTISDVTVRNSIADGTYIKRFVDLWSGVSDVKVQQNKLMNFGANAGPNAGSYAIMEYDDAYALHNNASAPTNITISDNRIIRPYSNGNYCAGGVDVHLVNNYVEGQSDTADTGLPKGGLSTNGCSGEISGNTLVNNYRGIVISAAATGSRSGFIVEQNRIQSDVPRSACIRVIGSLHSSGDAYLLNNTANCTGPNSVGIQIDGGDKMGGLTIKGGTVGGRAFGINAKRQGVVGRRISISDVEIGGDESAAAINLPGITTPISISNVRIGRGDYGARGRVNVRGSNVMSRGFNGRQQPY